MKKRLTLSIIIVAFLSFMAGQWYQQFRYDDICLDMGGGRNPGNYPICVIENSSGS